MLFFGRIEYRDSLDCLSSDQSSHHLCPGQGRSSHGRKDQQDRGDTALGLRGLRRLLESETPTLNP